MSASIDDFCFIFLEIWNDDEVRLFRLNTPGTWSHLTVQAGGFHILRMNASLAKSALGWGLEPGWPKKNCFSKQWEKFFMPALFFTPTLLYYHHVWALKTVHETFPFDVFNPPTLPPPSMKTDSPSSKADGWMPKHTGNPFRNLSSSRLVLWKVKAPKVVGMAWGELRCRFKFRATTCLSKRKKSLWNPPHSPQRKIFPSRQQYVGLMISLWKKQVPRLSILWSLWFAMVTLHWYSVAWLE